MVEGLMAAGVRRVRITGGEPLLHREILPIIEGLARLRLEDLALTTNATRLAKLAQPLRRAGLHRLNISLDSLDPQTFHRMTRGGDLHLVLEGIEAALSAGFVGTKLNAVVVRGENDHELETLVHYCWDRGITPRFLEVMMIGEGAKMRDRVVSGTEIRARLAHLLEQDVAVADPHRGPAKYVSSRHDQRLRVGFITGTTDTYCDTCDRMRVGADGFLRPCLAKGDGVSAAFAARTGNVSSVAHTVHEAWSLKPDGQTFKGCTEKSAADLSIRAIGG
jgi:cyclic pyranopterin phosphate synthase